MPVRLACVKPAASVRSEPGSNSQVERFDRDYISRKLTETHSQSPAFPPVTRVMLTKKRRLGRYLLSLSIRQTRKDTAATLLFLSSLVKEQCAKGARRKQRPTPEYSFRPQPLNTSERTKHRGAPSMKMVYSRPSSVSTADQNFFQRSVYSFCRHLIRASIHARKERKFLAG